MGRAAGGSIILLSRQDQRLHGGDTGGAGRGGGVGVSEGWRGCWQRRGAVCDAGAAERRAVEGFLAARLGWDG